MTRLGTALCSLIAFGTLACDLTVEPNRTTVLADNGLVLGVNSPNAVAVRPGGRLIVASAEVRGRGRLIEDGDRLRQVGAAIVSSGGFVQVAAGAVSGGSLLVVPQDPTTPAPLIDLDDIFSSNQLAPGIAAVDSIVEIDGGTVTSSGAFGAIPFGLLGAPAISVTRSDLSIRGGTLRPAALPASKALDPNLALQATQSGVTIEGGVLEGIVNVAGSQTLIRGGRLQALDAGGLPNGQGAMPPPEPGCTEIRGGTIGELWFSSTTETVFIFGSGFNLPLGRVDTRRDLTPILIMIGGPIPPPVEVRGRLQDGTPIDVQPLGAAGNLFLAAPGDPGCGF